MPGTALFRLIVLLILAAHCLPSHAQHDGPAMNYERISETLVTGGHLTSRGLERIKAEGVTVVVDLRDEPPAGYGERLNAAGIEWINVPVVWRSPKLGDYEAFRAAMAGNDGAHIFVQCQANYRASAMTYLYRVLEEGVAERDAAKAMHRIWTLKGRWQRYIDDVKSQYRN